tara:strand:- start:10826 stop:12160 length:1335 start_codon:yes stop_codon:yes gene_type:complete
LKAIKTFLFEQSHFKSILFSSGIAFILKIIGMLIAYISIVLISNIYGSNIVGIFSVISSIVLVLSMVGSMGINTATLRYTGQFTDDNNNLFQLYKNGFLISLYASLIIGLLLFLSSKLIAVNLFDNLIYSKLLKFSAILLPFMANLNINVQFLVGIKRFKASEFLRSVSTPLIIVLMIFSKSYLFDSNYFSIYALGIGIILSSIFSNIAILRYFKNLKYTPDFDKEFLITKSSLFQTSFPMMITAASALLLSNISVIMCEIFLSSNDVGLFSVSWKIAAVVPLIMLAFNSMSGPKFADLFWNKKYEQLQQTIRKSTIFVFITSLFFALLIILFSDFLLGMFGKDFIATKDVLLLLIISQMIYCSFSANGIFLNMVGEQQLFAKIILSSLLINIFLNIFLIPTFGIIGAAISNVITSFILNVLSAYIIKNKFNFKTYYYPKTLNF